MAEIGYFHVEDINDHRGRDEFVRMRVRVEWTQREVSENLRYLFRAWLYEEDDARDFFVVLPDGEPGHRRIGDRDDLVPRGRRRPFVSMWIQPDGRSSWERDFDEVWDFKNKERGNEEYFVMATVVPEVRGDVRSSPKFRRNLSENG